MADLFWNFGITIVLLLRRQRGTRTSPPKSSLEENNYMPIKKYFRVTINFYKKDCLPVLARNKKHSPEKFVPRTFILEKKKFSSWYYSRFGSCFFSDRTKKLKLCLHHMSLLSIFKEEQTKQILSMRNKFSFLYVDIQFDVQKFQFILKSSSLKCCSSFCLFLRRTQK